MGLSGPRMRLVLARLPHGRRRWNLVYDISEISSFLVLSNYNSHLNFYKKVYFDSEIYKKIVFREM